MRSSSLAWKVSKHTVDTSTIADSTLTFARIRITCLAPYLAETRYWESSSAGHWTTKQASRSCSHGSPSVVHNTPLAVQFAAVFLGVSSMSAVPCTRQLPSDFTNPRRRTKTISARATDGQRLQAPGSCDEISNNTKLPFHLIPLTFNKSSRLRVRSRFDTSGLMRSASFKMTTAKSARRHRISQPWI